MRDWFANLRDIWRRLASSTTGALWVVGRGELPLLQHNFVRHSPHSRIGDEQQACLNFISGMWRVFHLVGFDKCSLYCSLLYSLMCSLLCFLWCSLWCSLRRSLLCSLLRSWTKSKRECRTPAFLLFIWHLPSSHPVRKTYVRFWQIPGCIMLDPASSVENLLGLGNSLANSYLCIPALWCWGSSTLPEPWMIH